MATEVVQRSSNTPSSSGSTGTQNAATASGFSTARTGSTAPQGMPGANDPSYLAYMRGMGVEEGNINILAGTRADALQRQLNRGLPAYAEQREQAVEGAGDAAESRGMYRSGRRMTEQARVGRESDRARMDFETGIRDQMTELFLNNAMQIATIRRDFLERGYDYATANAIANAQAGL